MKIIFVCNEYPPSNHGGIGIFVKTMAEALVKKGWRVGVIGFDDRVSSNKFEIENGVIVRRLHYKKYKGKNFIKDIIQGFLSRYYLSKKLEEFINVFKPELVESYDWSGPLWRKPSVATVVRIHGSNTAYQTYEKKRISKILHFYERRNLTFGDCHIAVSGHIGELTQKVFNLKLDIKKVYNGVDASLFNVEKADVIRDNNKILYVGRINPRKGLFELFSSLNRVLRICNDCYLELYGFSSPDFESKLLTYIQPEFRSRIHFMGKIDHHKLPLIYMSSGVICVPSRAEAFGLTVIEAMACRLPVVMTDRASGPEIIENGVDGHLIDTFNERVFADKIIEVLKNTQESKSLGEQAATKVKNHFSLEKTLQQNINIYSENFKRGIDK